MELLKISNSSSNLEREKQSWWHHTFRFQNIVKVKVTQLCPTLGEPMDYTVHGILQTRLLEWAAAAKSLQSCPTLCDPIDSSPPGSPIPRILQARTLEWVAISFSNAWRVKVKSLSHVRLLATPWTAAYQASPSMGFSRQENWSGVPSPSPPLWAIHPHFSSRERLSSDTS